MLLPNNATSEPLIYDSSESSSQNNFEIIDIKMILVILTLISYFKIKNRGVSKFIG